MVGGSGENFEREVEAKKRKLQEAMEKESTMNDVRMSDDDLRLGKGLDGLVEWCKQTLCPFGKVFEPGRML